MRRTGQQLALVTLMVAGAVFTAVPGSGAASFTVTAERFRFTPKVLEVRSGDVVSWEVPAGDRATHTVTFGDGAELNLAPGDKKGFPFDAPPNDYRYYCRNHVSQGMSGTIRVLQADTTTTSSSSTTTSSTTTSSTTTSTTAPPTTTTTTTAPPTTTTTTPPATSPPTTSPPGTTPTTAPAAGGTTVTTAPPAPTTTAPITADAKKKKKSDGTTTSTAGKDKAKAAGAQSSTTTTEPVPTEAAEMFDPSVIMLTEPPTTGSSTPSDGEDVDSDEVASSPKDRDGSPKAGVPIKAAGAGIGGVLVAIAAWAWYHRSSRYLPA